MSAPKRVIFHVGLPKTGTTTIQHYLRRHDEKLRSLGFLYPGLREHPALASHRHPLMINAMLGKAREPAGDLDADACRDVVAAAFGEFHQSDLENLLWSCEGMALSARNWDVAYLRRLLTGADVRLVLFARFTDEWVQSLVKERLRGRSGARAEALNAKPLRLAPAKGGLRRARPGGRMSLLERGAEVVECLRIMRRTLPAAEIVVRSFDEHRKAGTVVSGALAAMGVPVAGAFPDADDEAGVHNPTKSDLYGMLLYHLVAGEAGSDVIRAVAVAVKKRESRGKTFEPLNGRRFRFLSDEDARVARGYYEALRRECPHLPVQPPYVSKPTEGSLSKDDGVALLDWLKPDISDAVFERACAAYPAAFTG